MAQRHGGWGFWGQTTWRDYASGNEKDLHTVELTSKWHSGKKDNKGGGWGYTQAALATSGVLLADDVTGIGAIDDIAIPFILAAAVTYDLYTNGVFDKMTREIDRIMQKAKGPQGVMYALVANHSGLYPNVRGGTTFLNAKDVWKYGETTDPAGRYSDSYLRGMGLQRQNLFTGNQMEIKIQEKIMIYGYFMLHGTLPAGNRLFR